MLGLTPAPPGARFHGTLPKLGAPVHIAEYADQLRSCAYLVAGDPAVGTEAHRRYLTWIYGADVGGWVQRALPDQPRPIYRPYNLEQHPDWPVYVFEREDMVDAFHDLSGEAEVIATTIPGGADAFPMGAWEPLYGREVRLWPTNKIECVQRMHDLARALEKAGANVSIITIPQDKPQGWSFLHVVENGWNWDQVEAFIAENRKKVEAQIIPISAARLASAPPVAEVEPRKAKQPPAQVVSFRDAWARIPGLTYAPNGTPYSNVYNITCALVQRQLDVWFDEFHFRVMVDSQKPRFWTDEDDTELTCRLQGELGLAASRTPTVHEAVSALAHRTRRHEVRDWLRSLTWDGSNRLALMLPIGYGTPSLPYYTSVGRCFLMGAVARILHPGCQVDYVPVFEGPGALGKTSSLRVLFGKWFDNPSSMMGDKDFLQNMCGKWCLELGELANLHGRAIEIVKSIITRQIDTYRASFGRAPGDYPRQCIFAGTIDRNDWNADEAGGRRWWPVICGAINLEWLRDNRDQLFAEAVVRVESEEKWYNVDPRDAAVEQALRRPREHWMPLIERYLEKQTETTLENVMRGPLEYDKASQWKTNELKRVVIALRWLGWSERDGGKRWVAPPPKP